MPNTEEQLQRTLHEVSGAGRDQAREAGKRVGAALDQRNSEIQSTKDRQYKENVEYAGKQAQRHVDKAPKYFYFNKV